VGQFDVGCDRNEGPETHIEVWSSGVVGPLDAMSAGLNDVGTADNFWKFVGGLWELKWEWQSCLGLSIGIDDYKIFQLKFLFWHQNCRSHSFGRFVGVRVGVAHF